MSPILGLSDARRAQRLGKIHLGKKVANANDNGEHPIATPYFVCPPELLAAMGLPADGKPTELEIMFPGEDPEKIAPQYYRRWSGKGLTCEGDGQTCTMRLVDADKGGEIIAAHDCQNVVLERGLPCAGRDCPEYTSKPQRCKECMNLIFLIPSCPGVGIYQLDTSSVHSIININSQIGKAAPGVPEGFIRNMMHHHIAFIPLTLSLVGKEVVNPEDPKHNKKKIHVLSLNTKLTLFQLREEANKTAKTLMLTTVPAPAVDEPPDDNEDDGTLSGSIPLNPIQKPEEKKQDIVIEKQPETTIKPPAAEKPPVDPNAATQAQINKIMASGKAKGVAIADVGTYAMTKWQIAHMNKLSKKQASEIIELIEGGKFKEELNKLIPQDTSEIFPEETKPPEQTDADRRQALTDKIDEQLAKPIEPPKANIDMDWLKTALKRLKYEPTIFSLIASIPLMKGIDITSKDIGKVVAQMSKEQAEALNKVLHDRAGSQGINLD